MSPEVEQRLKLVLQRALVLAQTGVLGIEHIANTRGADETRKTRYRAHNRRQIQRGEVLSASKACQIVKTHEDAEVVNAQKQLHKAKIAKKVGYHGST